MDDEITVSLFRREDAPGVVRCYREIYGDGFPMRYVYDQEEIIKRYDGLNHRTAVARTREGEVVGIAGLFRSAPNPGLYEAGQLMIRKEHRKCNLSPLLSNALFEEFPRQIPVKAVFVEALCNYDASQGLAESNGLKPTGLEVEWMPARLQGIELKRNISLLLEFRIYEDTPHTIHVHPEYAGFIAERAEALKVTRSRETNISPGTSETLARREIIADIGIAVLTVDTPGRYWAETLAAFEAEGTGCAMQVRLNVGRPDAPWAVEQLRGRGFILGGYLPLWFGQDGMMFQKLPQVPDFAAHKLYSEAGRSVMARVEKDQRQNTDGDQA
jgi:hypothetical protein